MKPAYYLIFIALFLTGGIILFHSPGTNKTGSVAGAVAPTSAPSPTHIPSPPQVSEKPGNTQVQVIKATYSPFGFTPTELKVKANNPVRLEVYASEDGRGCMGSITIPAFTRDIQGFVKGQTDVFEFTPTSPGKYPIVCAMGIPHGYLIVE
jgi:heme/copper-type cytochrome/quinol oxidase subunit 2